jgi:pimeloyl-ACP methyl ester carboxylesterase
MLTPPTLRPAERRRRLTLSDGRQLAWSEWGPADGTPALFCSGAATSGSLGLDAAAVAEAGVLLIGVDRPGLGQSSAHPSKTLTSWADDVAYAARRCDWSPLAAIGFSQGGPFALALAAEGIVECVALVSAQDDLSAHLNSLEPHVLGLLTGVRTDAAAVERHLARTMTADSFLEMIGDMSGDVDRSVYCEPAFWVPFSAAVHEAFRQGATGCARDLILAMGKWPFALEDIRVPVDIWYGEHDTSPVHSPDHGAKLAERLPRSMRHVVSGAGGSVAWTHTADILAALRTAGV